MTDIVIGGNKYNFESLPKELQAMFSEVIQYRELAKQSYDTCKKQEGIADFIAEKLGVEIKRIEQDSKPMGEITDIKEIKDGDKTKTV